jgi:hypothetical protein
MKQNKTPAAALARSRRWKAKNKDAVHAYWKKWYAENRGARLEYLKAYCRAWYQNPKHQTEARMRANKRYNDTGRALGRYGLRQEDVDALIESQGGGCAICNKTGPLCIDHNHKTTAVRGMLCRNCNLGIGFLKDDPAIIQRAVDYLKAAQAAQERAA